MSGGRPGKNAVFRFWLCDVFPCTAGNQSRWAGRSLDTQEGNENIECRTKLVFETAYFKLILSFLFPYLE